MPGCIVLTLLQNPIFLGFLIMCLLFLCGHLSIILMLLYHWNNLVGAYWSKKGHVFLLLNTKHSVKRFQNINESWRCPLISLRSSTSLDDSEHYIAATYHYLLLFDLFLIRCIDSLLCFYLCLTLSIVSLQALGLLSFLGNLLNTVFLVWIICQELCWCTTLTCPCHTGSIFRQFFATPLNSTRL
jgi:hypothetical protein